jgi:hypothetical protein
METVTDLMFTELYAEGYFGAVYGVAEIIFTILKIYFFSYRY